MLALRFVNIITRARRTLPFASQKVKKFLFLVSCILFLYLYPIPYTLYPTHAADSTPSADVKAKLEALKQEIASKAAKLKQEINQKLTNKAYIGVVKSKTSTSITLAAKSGSKIVSVNQDTAYQDTSTGKIKGTAIQTIKEESFIAALGDVDDTGVLTAKKVVILPITNNQSPKTFLWGQVISTSDELMTVKDKSNKNQTVAVNPNTIYKSKNKISRSDIENGDSLIVSGVKNKNEIVEAGFIYVIPKTSTPKPSAIASPSGTIKVATPSGKKK